jgi:hypothetical protein
MVIDKKYDNAPNISLCGQHYPLNYYKNVLTETHSLFNSSSHSPFIHCLPTIYLTRFCTRAFVTEFVKHFQNF